MTVYFRRAVASDVEGIMRIERASFPDDAWSSSTMRAEVTGGHGYYLVAVDDEADTVVLGYGGLLAPAGAEQGDIQTIAIDGSRRGGGLGRALMEALIAEARRRGTTEVFLEVRADNPVAHGLYVSLGFVELGVRPRYYPGGVDAVVMRLEVPPAIARPADAVEVDSVTADRRVES